MIRVTIELIPYGTGKPIKLGEMTIANDGFTTRETNGRRGTYNFKIFGKKNWLAAGRVENYSRSKNVWYLVARCLKNGGYS